MTVMGAALDMNMVSAAVLQPHFDAVRDVFVEAHRKLGFDHGLDKVRFRVDPKAHDTERHFAATLSTGLQQLYAPEAADLPIEPLTAIICHEWGHSDDFLHPGKWLVLERNKPAVVVPDDLPEKKKKKLWRQWLERSDDEIEWWADAIAHAVTGKRIGYCGPCLIQCFDGRPRPKGLR